MEARMDYVLLPVVNFIEKHCLNWFRAVFFLCCGYVNML
ncbi:hypothetical protein SAMN05421868_112134 [Paenibacillus naphthalenovorans]|nr:hypothetical protein SAMN05421868_112134 [Paenibacillus naphthalenovorans]